MTYMATHDLNSRSATLPPTHCTSATPTSLLFLKYAGMHLSLIFVLVCILTKNILPPDIPLTHLYFK